MAADSSPPGKPACGRVPWRNPRFDPAIDRVRHACGVAEHDREDDALIGMLLDRFKFDHSKVVDMYRKSSARRDELGMREIKDNILANNLRLEHFPHHLDVGKVSAPSLSHLSHLPFCPVCDHPFCPLTTRHFVALDWPGGAHLCQHVDRQERAETFARCCGRQQ